MKIHLCHYCKQPLDEQHYQRAKETGRYQCTWKGDISCKKCFFLTEEQTQAFYKAGEELGKKTKPRLVTILEIPISKPRLGKARRTGK